jgi:hypothetical protein
MVPGDSFEPFKEKRPALSEALLELREKSAAI